MEENKNHQDKEGRRGKMTEKEEEKKSTNKKRGPYKIGYVRLGKF